MSVAALSIIGWSGAGKTTLLCRLLPELTARGVRAVAVKHSAHVHPLHKRGSDTERLATAGAEPVGFFTPQGLQLTATGGELDVVEQVARFAPSVQLLL